MCELFSAEGLTAGAIAFGSAFFGAFAAFLLENARQARKETRKDRESGNAALFTLAKLTNDLIVLRKQLIDPVRDNPGRAIAMSALTMVRNPSLRFDFPSLAFLLELRQPELLMALLLHEDRFDSVVTAVNARSKQHVKEVQPALERAGIDLAAGARIQDVRDALGSRIFDGMVRMTDDLVEMVDESISLFRTTLDELSAVLKKKFPKAKFVSLGDEITAGDELARDGDAA